MEGGEIMNNENMAVFISELRKSKNMTQKQLANKLNITDKAVSKWERGAGYPDITLLTSLADILGVTVTELLNGRRNSEIITESNAIIEDVIEYADKVTNENKKNFRSIASFVLTMTFLSSILICIICNLAINRTLSWSNYPTASLIFAWLIFIPFLKFKKHGITLSLLSLSIFIVPFLFVLGQIIGNEKTMISIGVPTSLLSIVFIWIAFYILAVLKINYWYSASIILIISIPYSILINFVIAKALSENRTILENALSAGITGVLVITCLCIGYFSKRKVTNK